MRKTRRVRWIGILAVGLALLVGFAAVGQWPPVPQPPPGGFTPIDHISPLSVLSIAGKTPATTSTGAPTVQFSVVTIELDGFDLDGPPQVVVFDDVTNEAFFETHFIGSSNPADEPAQKLSFSIQLAYDRNPWANPGKEPSERVSRIEVSNAHGTQTFYVKLKAGIFVVPVVWHNVVEPGGQNYVEQIYTSNGLGAVYELFMTAPTIPSYSGMYFHPSLGTDMNTIWGQAGIQFHLLDVTLPYAPGEIVDFVDPSAGHTSSASEPCSTGWSPADAFNSPEGVDIYAVYSLKGSGGSAIGGLGNCFGYGSVYIAAGAPGGGNDAFTSTFNSAPGRAILVAHEFGHFLGSLAHTTTTNLMNPYLGDWEMTQAQIDQVRQQIKNRGSYLEGK